MKVYASLCKFMQVYCKITRDENIQLLFLERDPIYILQDKLKIEIYLPLLFLEGDPIYVVP